MQSDEWIGVDLDGTLAMYSYEMIPDIGPPIPAMVDRVKAWLADGRDVRIFTARVGNHADEAVAAYAESNEEFVELQTIKIDRWCEEHIGRVLPITASKDFLMVELWDDRCVQMVTNTGQTLEESLTPPVPTMRELRRG